MAKNDISKAIKYLEDNHWVRKRNKGCHVYFHHSGFIEYESGRWIGGPRNGNLTTLLNKLTVRPRYDNKRLSVCEAMLRMAGFTPSITPRIERWVKDTVIITYAPLSNVWEHFKIHTSEETQLLLDALNGVLHETIRPKK